MSKQSFLCLCVMVFVECFFDLRTDRKKGRQYIRIEMGTAGFFQNAKSTIGSVCLLVDPFAGQGIKDIHNGHDAGTERNLVSV